MSEPISPATSPVFGVKAATILGAVFLVLYALCAGLGAADRSHRSQLETMEARPIEEHPVVAPK